jgi:hypothetical protein
MTTINSISINNNKDFDDEDDVDIWSPSRIADAIFNDLMENGYDDISKSNKYIIQIIKKFRYIRIKLEEIHFEISFRDLNNEAIEYIVEYTKDCKTAEDKYARLDGIFTEVIARIIKQAEPAILSSYTDESKRSLAKVALNETREVISYRWRLVGGDINYE